jgi:small subunit ribosomal protein S20
MKTNIKKMLVALQGKNKDELQQAYKDAVVCIDKAASKGVIHKNNASRRISRLSKKVGQSPS